TSAEPDGWPFAFTVSGAHLLFCIRPLGVRTLHLTRTSLARHIGTVRKRADTGLQVTVRNRREADALVEQVLSRWPAGKSPDEDRALVEARNGLGQFRSSVERVEGACRVTGVMDRRHLRAVHIKPWESCGDAERLDGCNGLLLSPHVAHLFERGYISFSEDGQLLVARQLNSTVLKRWAISLPIAARPFVARQKPYLAWHREHVFEKAGAGHRRKG
ncbi:MAG TPA: HNH endonuclease, partial [Steroidobacteraceae bacterium]|nr:HNH endonuclease [Steroidobacteraceae bacterium]